MDRDFEADNLAMFSDWNDDDFQPTFLQTDTSLTAFDDANLMELFNSQTELPPLPTALLEPMNEIIDPTWSYQCSTAEPLTFVPNPLPPLQPNTPVLNAQPLNNPPSSSGEGLMLDGAVPSLQSEDMTLAGYFNQLSELQNANSVQIQNNNYNYNVINNYQSSSYPALLNQNPGRPANGDRGQTSGAFAPHVRPTLLNDDTINNRAAWSSRPEQLQFSASDVYGAQYAPNYAQSPQPFAQVQNQIDHASNLQQVLDLHPQDSRRSVYPTGPRSEPFSNVQPGSVTMQSNPFQPSYKSMLPNLAAPSGSSVASYGQNPNPFATSSSSFGSGSSVLPRHPHLYGNQDQRHLPQVMRPNDQVQQSSSSMQQWSQIGEYNQRKTTSNLQRQISTSSQNLISRFLGHSSSSLTEGTSSRVPNSREAGIASVLRLQQEATGLPNEVLASRDRGKQPGTSSNESEPSDAIQRILNMNPSRMISRSTPGITDQSGGFPTERVPYVPPRRGRPPKRREPIESYTQRAKSFKLPSEAGRRGSIISQRVQRTTNGVVIRDPSVVLPNPPSVPRHFDNAVYDMEFERQGQPLDPHLRFFRPPPPPPER